MNDIEQIAFKIQVNASISDLLLSDKAPNLYHFDSPIEQMIYHSLVLAAHCRVTFVHTCPIHNMDYPKGVGLIIEPQAMIGDYRVDFLLKLKLKQKTKQMIIECDGHDFHEKTKEQAKKDRKRDRTLQGLGFLVFRFTGSEIWEDCFKCAFEALNILINIGE